jgi:hypothetical protein
MSLYPNQITNVTFISRTTSSTGRYILTFQAIFTKVISDRSLRTAIVSNIQSIYYAIIKRYFATVSKTLKFPTTTQINVPVAISTTLKDGISFNTDTSKSTSISSTNNVSLLIMFIHFFYLTKLIYLAYCFLYCLCNIDKNNGIN